VRGASRRVSRARIEIDGFGILVTQMILARARRRAFRAPRAMPGLRALNASVMDVDASARARRGAIARGRCARCELTRVTAERGATRARASSTRW